MLKEWQGFAIMMAKIRNRINAKNEINEKANIYFDYNLKLQARDGRVRVEISNFFHHNKPGNQKKAQLGFLTTADIYADSGIQKKHHNIIKYG